MVGALSCETGLAGSMLNKVIFHDARASLIQYIFAVIKTTVIVKIVLDFEKRLPRRCRRRLIVQHETILSLLGWFIFLFIYNTKK